MELPSEDPAVRADNNRRLQALQVALDLIDQGFTLIDSDLRLVAWNAEFLRLLDFPDDMAYVGAPFDSFIRYNALRGEYGPGDPEEQTTLRVASAKGMIVHEMERLRPNGTLLSVRGVPVPQHGFITLYSDITEQRQARPKSRNKMHCSKQPSVHAPWRCNAPTPSCAWHWSTTRRLHSRFHAAKPASASLRTEFLL